MWLWVKVSSVKTARLVQVLIDNGSEFQKTGAV